MKAFYVLLLSLLTSLTAQGQSLAGVDLSYVRLSQDQYRIKVRLYQSCSASLPTISYHSACGSTGTLTLSTVLYSQALSTGCLRNSCQTSNPLAPPGVELVEYTGILNLPSQDTCSQWHLRFTRCCRGNLDNLQNANQYATHVEALIIRTQANSSPEWPRPQTLMACAGSTHQWSQAASDVDGDSLVYALIPVAESPTNTIPYSTGRSPSQPFGGNSTSLDAQTGMLSFQSSQTQTIAYALQIQEFRAGQLVGMIQRDLNVYVWDCNYAQTAYAAILDTQALANVQLQLQIRPDSCQALPKGQVVASSNVPQPQYRWSLGRSGDTLANVYQGWYSVTVTSRENGCFSHENVYVPNSNCWITVTGQVLADPQGRCNPQGLEPMPNVLVLNFPGPARGYSDSLGNYQLELDRTGNSQLNAYPHNGKYRVVCPNAGHALSSNQMGQSLQGYHFYVQGLSDQDLGLSLHERQPARINRTQTLVLELKNYGNRSVQQPVLVYRYPLGAQVQGNTPGAVLDATERSLTWSLDSIKALSSLQFEVELRWDANLVVGTTHCHQAEVSPLLGDAQAQDNQLSHCVQLGNVLTSNHKQIFPHGEGEALLGGYYLASDSALHYRLAFQNQGIETVKTVFIRDTLNANAFDLSTVEVIGASHPYRLFMDGSNVLVLAFFEINLPPAVYDSLGSQGFIDFRINRRVQASGSGQIANRAGLYFDFNFGYLTNTVNSFLRQGTAVAAQAEEASLAVYPNPAQEGFQVKWNVPLAKGLLSCYDALGRQVWQRGVSEQEGQFWQSVEGLPSGCYHLILQHETGQLSTKIIVP